MTMPDVSGLPENLDATFADDPENPSRKQHQQNHDLVHRFLKWAASAFVTTEAASATYETIANVDTVEAAVVAAQSKADAAAATAEAATRGDISMIYTGDGTTHTYVLGPGQADDGVSARVFKGGPDGAPELEAGYVAREGDWQLGVNV